MPDFECEGFSVTRRTLKATTRHEAAKAFRAAAGFWPATVSEACCLGACEACREPVFEDEPHVDNGDEVIHFEECPEVAGV